MFKSRKNLRSNLNNVPFDCMIHIFQYLDYDDNHKDLFNIAISNSLQYEYVCFYLNEHCGQIKISGDIGYSNDPYSKKFNKKHLIKRYQFIKRLLKNSKGIKVNMNGMDKEYNKEELITFLDNQIKTRDQFMGINHQYVAKYLICICIFPFLLPFLPFIIIILPIIVCIVLIKKCRSK